MTETPRLVGSPRHRVRYWPQGIGKGHARYVTTLGKPAQGHSAVIGAFVTFSDQKNGNLHIISADLVESIEIQRQDAQYGEWYTVGSVQVQRSTA